jgi:hypothetical protein
MSVAPMRPGVHSCSTDAATYAFCLHGSPGGLWTENCAFIYLRRVRTPGVTVLTGYLRAELLQLGAVEEVLALPACEPAPGARVFGVAAAGVLLIALGQSVAVCGRWCL